MRTWVGIVRVSHMGARKAGTEAVHTDRDQLAAIQSATPPGDRLEVLPPELDVSGGLPLSQRPSLRVAVEGVEAGQYAGIIVAYQSRLFRNVEEEEALWRRIEAAGGEVLLALDGIDTKTIGGRMVRRIKSAMNTAEREEHVERFDRLREWATNQGIWQRRQTPTGYARHPETRKLVPDERAPLVKRAFAEYNAGATLLSIATLLEMTPSGARQLLRNRVYLGELRVGQYVNPTAHPALVDEETFERAQQRRSARPAKRQNGPALLAGIVRCVSCGKVMTRHTSKGGHVYGCVVHHSGGRCPHPASIAMHRLDPYVEAIALRELAKLRIDAAEGGGVENARRAVVEAQRALDAFLDAIDPQDVGAEAFNRAARKKRAAVDDAQDELRAALDRSPALAPLGEPTEVWAALNQHERNTLLRGLLEAVIVRPVGRGKRVEVADRVRVVKFGAGVDPLTFPDRDDIAVLGIPSVEDGLEDEGGVG